jgi:hypothetical protein
VQIFHTSQQQQQQKSTSETGSRITRVPHTVVHPKRFGHETHKPKLPQHKNSGDEEARINHSSFSSKDLNKPQLHTVTSTS